MQAAMATFDWISKTGSFKDVCGMLRKPERDSQKFKRYYTPLITLIEEVLKGAESRMN
jgi:hypothetical protein